MDAQEREKPLVKDLNEHIVCPLCRGYLIDATTLAECLHSFCRGCIVRRLSSGARECPVCSVATLPPLLPDVGLQRMVYLLVPGLFRSEIERRRHFRLVNPQCPPLASPLGALDLTLDDFVSLSLCELAKPEAEAQTETDREEELDDAKPDDTTRGKSTRYLKCPAAVTVRHLVRLLMLKRGWEEANSVTNLVNRIEIMYEESDKQIPAEATLKSLDLSWTLLDLACIFNWKRETPMKLFYRVLRKEEGGSTSEDSPYNDEATKDNTNIENIQRPPTPPPSPKPAEERELEGRRTVENSTETPRTLEHSLERDKETKTKKPRCEVTPVMRAPEPPGLVANHTPQEATKSKELSRLEHRKRRKRRNKRVIAEITTTPREDLLKLKVRLTPCPPRITSSTGSGQTKEKLLQMRAVRREKLKATSINQQRPGLEGATGAKESHGEPEETIEEIIDSIPDEVVRIAQNITGPAGEEANPAAVERSDQRNASVTCRAPPKATEEVAESDITKSAEPIGEAERPKKDEEILRRLGLVAVAEANEKTKQRAQAASDKIESLDREKLEKQLRESKANRVRSLLAEKQMRDALKSIMSKSKEERSSPMPATPAPKKKGPPPLAPLRVAKPSGFATTNAILESNNSKYESPLDLSSAGTMHDNVLDLSAGLTAGVTFSTSTSASSSSTPSLVSSLGGARAPRPPVPAANFIRKTKDTEQRRGQESNLRTLSDAAVSLLSGCITDKSPVDPLVLSSASLASKVALRIPQPHQRISGFGMKIKPNLGIRHIPNPQAVVASQYRNQRASYFSAASQQPP